MTHPGKSNLGFTLLEIIVVIVIIAILSAVAVTRAFSTDPYTLKAQTDLIKNRLRYAQLLSMNSDTAWGIHFSSASNYSLFKNADISQVMTFPGENGSTVTLPFGVNITTGVVAYNDWGQPSTTASGDPPASSNVSLIASCGGATESITVTRNTGYIP